MATMQTKSVRRREDLRLLTGKGNYAADAAPAEHGGRDLSSARPTRMHGLTRSTPPRAHGLPGVIAVYTAADLTDVAPIAGGIGFPRPDGGPAPKTDRPLLAGDRVRFVGEPVALVIAETRAAGLEAAEAIVVDYTALPVVTEPEAAMTPNAPAGLGRRARQYRLSVEARRRRRRRRGFGRLCPCHDAGFHRLPRHRQFDGAARRLGSHRRGRSDRAACLPSVAVRSAQRNRQRATSRSHPPISACSRAMSAARSA